MAKESGKHEILVAQIKAFEKDLDVLHMERNDPNKPKKDVSQDLYNQVKIKLDSLNKELESEEK